MSSESQQVVGGPASSSTPLASEMSSLEDSTFNKVGKLSVEQRKEKIHKYMKKRNERNFNKKIKVYIYTQHIHNPCNWLYSQVQAHFSIFVGKSLNLTSNFVCYQSGL